MLDWHNSSYSSDFYLSPCDAALYGASGFLLLVYI